MCVSISLHCPWAAHGRPMRRPTWGPRAFVWAAHGPPMGDLSPSLSLSTQNGFCGKGHLSTECSCTVFMFCLQMVDGTAVVVWAAALLLLTDAPPCTKRIAMILLGGGRACIMSYRNGVSSGLTDAVTCMECLFFPPVPVASFVLHFICAALSAVSSVGLCAPPCDLQCVYS